MKKKLILLSALFLSLPFGEGWGGALFAGNPDRSGQAGATELLINPWARSSGWAGSDVAGAHGLEAMFTNIAGTAFTKNTELLFSNTQWLKGSGITINSFGLTQHVGETGVLGLAIMSMNFGEIPITTVNQPEGGIGTYSPQFLNIALSYAKGFSDNIFGGLAAKIVTEKMANLNSTGVALDAGIQYVAGKHDQLKFGISLKNVGPRMMFTGDGLSFKAPVPASTQNNTMTVDQRSQDYELPSSLNIGAGYDFYILQDTTAKKTHRITVMGAFSSNSFENDQFKIGLEYGWKNILMLRAGYTYEQIKTSALTGPSAGFTFEIPFGKNKSTFAIDYSYRATDPFSGTHSIGARINL